MRTDKVKYPKKWFTFFNLKLHVEKIWKNGRMTKMIKSVHVSFVVMTS